MLKSKRFWIFLATICGAIGSAYAGEITWLQALQAAIVAATAITISDSIRKVGTP
jgi:hypothetical protein